MVFRSGEYLMAKARDVCWKMRPLFYAQLHAGVSPCKKRRRTGETAAPRRIAGINGQKIVQKYPDWAMSRGNCKIKV